MRVVETVYPAKNVRYYALDKKITNHKYVTSQTEADKNDLGVFYEKISNLHLVKSISIAQYEIRIEVVEAFSTESQTWVTIQEGLMSIIHKHFCEVVQFESALHRNLQAEEEKREAENIRLQEIGKILNAAARDGLYIPHNFATHRDAWRNALVLAKVTAENEQYSESVCNGEEEVPPLERNANASYWDHELKAYDESFEQLLSLKLPQK